MTLHSQRQMWQKYFSLMFHNTNLFLFWGLFHWHANNAVSVNGRSPFFLRMMFMFQKFLKWSGKREVWNVSLGMRHICKMSCVTLKPEGLIVHCLCNTKESGAGKAELLYARTRKSSRCRMHQAWEWVSVICFVTAGAWEGETGWRALFSGLTKICALAKLPLFFFSTA